MQFSEISCEPGCNQEDACSLEQGLDDEVEPIVVQAEALVLQQPGVGALDRPAPLAQAGAIRLPALADAGFRAALAAQVAVALGVLGLVGKRGPEQALKQEGVVDVGRRGRASNRYATAVERDMVLGALSRGLSDWGRSARRHAALPRQECS